MLYSYGPVSYFTLFLSRSNSASARMAFFLFVRTIRAYYVDILTKKCYSENRKPTRRRSVMAKTSTNISLDPELKRSSQELFADLGH